MFQYQRLSGKAVAEPRETCQKDVAESAKVSGNPLAESEISREIMLRDSIVSENLLN